jgi:hypothetical protein
MHDFESDSSPESPEPTPRGGSLFGPGGLVSALDSPRPGAEDARAGAGAGGGDRTDADANSGGEPCALHHYTLHPASYIL